MNCAGQSIGTNVTPNLPLYSTPMVNTRPPNNYVMTPSGPLQVPIISIRTKLSNQFFQCIHLHPDFHLFLAFKENLGKWIMISGVMKSVI